MFPNWSLSQKKLFAIGVGIYGLSSFLSVHVNAGLQVPLMFNFDIDSNIFDVYLRIAPGIGFSVTKLSSSFNWNFFVGFGIRFWI